jgi:hypothetical protein
LICRVGRVTECGGEVGRLNVVGGAEVCSFAFCGHSKVSHLIFVVGSQRAVFILKNSWHVFFLLTFLLEYSMFLVKVFEAVLFSENSLGKFDFC